MYLRPLIRISTVITVIAAAAMSAGCGRVPTPSNHGSISRTGPALPSPIPLPPNDRGYVRVETKSRSIGCSITAELVACQTFSGSWRDTNGQHHHTASVSADGEFYWVDADLGALQGRVPLDYRAYSAQSWTIVAGPAETKFVNDRGGHGMTVSDQRVTPF